MPVGLMRDVTEWFGLHMKLANTEMIVAQAESGQPANDNRFVLGRRSKCGGGQPNSKEWPTK